MMLGSNSKHKALEFADILSDYPEVQFKTLTDIVWNAQHLDRSETGQNYYENAYNKAHLAHFAAKVPTFADDSGLEIDVLDGRPGIRSHRYATPQTGETQDWANIKKVLGELEKTPHEMRSAHFVCTLVFFVEGLVLSATERLEGMIALEPRGQGGFGYDSIFVPRGSTRTLAEMSLQEKNQISHRALALRKLMTLIKEKGIEFVRP